MPNEAPEQQTLNVAQIKALAVGQSAAGDVEAVFTEAESYFDQKVIRWLRERIIPIIGELEQEAEVMADMLMEEEAR